MIISETFLETCQTNPWEKNQEKFIISIFVDQIYHFFFLARQVAFGST